MRAENYVYEQDNQGYQGFIAYDEMIKTPRPAVLIAHDWSGCNEFARHKASLLAEMGYVGFAIDMFGEGRIGSTIEEKTALIQPLVSNQTLLRQRVRLALDKVAQMPQVNPNQVAIIGFCFGGMCALELARSGAAIQGAVSVHGLLHQPEGHNPAAAIRAKILALHGYSDPMVKPEQVLSFCDEMTQAKVDWQMHMYGGVQHAFTNPQAHDTHLGTVYDELAARRAWIALSGFLQELFR